MKRKSEAGQALILTALSLTVLMGFAGLGIDMGVMRYEKRLQQTAADAAAIAGASDLPPNTGVTIGGQNAAAANGFADNGDGATTAPCDAAGAAVGTVCVQIGTPTSGPHQGKALYVEALVAAVHTTYFMRLLGIPTTEITARAVATNLSGATAGGGCLYTLGPPSSSIQGVNVQGSAVLNATTCGIEDNGNFDPTGGALTVHAGTFGVAGSCSGSGCGKGSVTCADQSGACPAVGMPAATNPLSKLTPPCSPCTGGGSPNGSSFSPGTYSSITLTGNGTDTFNPGVYVFDGSGITCHGTPTINGTGVMFYFTGSATMNCSGNDTINLTAPSPTNCAACPAQYDGILMYQDPADTNGPSLGGNTGSSYDGALYFPKSTVTFFGNSSGIDVAIIVADSFALSGNPTVNLTGNAGLPTGVTDVILDATLVE